MRLASVGMAVVCACALADAAGGQAAALPRTEQLLRAHSVKELDALRARDTNDPELHYAVGRAWWREKEWDKSEAALRTATAIAPQYAEAWLALGKLPERRGEAWWKQEERRLGEEAMHRRLDEYLGFTRRAFLLNPLVQLLPWQDDKPRETIAIGPYRLQLWWMADWRRGVIALHRGDADSAFRHLDRVKRDARTGASGREAPLPVLWYHGLAAARIAEWDQAIEDFAVLTGRGMHLDSTENFAATLSPFTTNDFRYFLATMLMQSGRHAEAVPVFRRVLEFDVGMYPARVQLARIHEAAGRLDEAIAERELAVSTFPEDASLHLDHGLTLARAGRSEEALEAVTRAARLNPRDPRAPLLQAELLMTLGHEQEARWRYERFLAIAPLRYTAQREQVRRALASLP